MSCTEVSPQKVESLGQIKWFLERKDHDLITSLSILKQKILKTKIPTKDNKLKSIKWRYRLNAAFIYKNIEHTSL